MSGVRKLDIAAAEIAISQLAVLCAPAAFRNILPMVVTSVSSPSALAAEVVRHVVGLHIHAFPRQVAIGDAGGKDVSRENL